MATNESLFEEVPFPVLFRFARRTYANEIRDALDLEGCSDIPRNGIFVLGAIARKGSPLSHIIKDLGMSKQAAGQLVDTLVLRGYLDREADPEDRRRMTVSLTERGALAASVTREAIEHVTAELLERTGAEKLAHAREVLGILIEMTASTEGANER